MISDAKVKSLKIEDGKRHADRDGLNTQREKGLSLSLPMEKETTNNHFR